MFVVLIFAQFDPFKAHSRKIMPGPHCERAGRKCKANPSVQCQLVACQFYLLLLGFFSPFFTSHFSIAQSERQSYYKVKTSTIDTAPVQLYSLCRRKGLCLIYHNSPYIIMVDGGSCLSATLTASRSWRGSV
jgi:hypothetical protein